ncbi:MAG: Maf family protein [Candidatus Thermoplasmatota archaeon]|nr:Maf family protein [Candidatus Thermoplasmatota archaeon]
MEMVLASRSPRRKALMEEAGLEFEVRSSNADEILEGSPTEIVQENARRKARSAVSSKDELIIGSDTMVECEGELLGKPKDRNDAERMILHQIDVPAKVFSGICILDTARDKELFGYEASTVFISGSREDVDQYLDSGLWEGKAGAFGIQDESSLDIGMQTGELDNVVGMPMILLRRLLGLVGFK